MPSSHELPLKPIPIKDRVSIVFLKYGLIDVKDGAFVLVDENGVRTHIPVGSVACIMLEPGTRISHMAVRLSSETGTLLVWVGEYGVRLYSSGQPGGARSDRLLYQARLALEDDLRLNVVRKMYELRFNEDAPTKRSVDQLRGIEGARVRKLYKNIAKRYGINWKKRNYDPEDWNVSDEANRCLSTATSCLYGITEAAVLAAGYSPAMGFIHWGKALSFVYDIADIFKFDTVVPIAFEIASQNRNDSTRAVRLACRDFFREQQILKKIIPTISEVLDSGGIKPPKMPKESVPPAIPAAKSIGEAGHRNR